MLLNRCHKREPKGDGYPVWMSLRLLGHRETDETQVLKESECH